MNINNLLTVARAFLAEKEYDKAIDVCLDILANENNKDAYIIIAESYFEKNMIDCSVEMFRKASEIYNTDYIVQYKLALALIAKNDLKSAQNVLKSTLVFSDIPRDKKAVIFSELSEIDYKLGNLDKAEDFIRQAITESNDNINYLQGLARLLYIKEKFSEAEKIFNNIIQQEGQIEVDNICYANILIALEKYDQALELLQNIKSKNHQKKSGILQSYIYFINGDIKSFNKCLKKVYRELKQYDDTYINIENLVFSLIRMDELEKSKKVLIEAINNLEDKENNIRIYVILAGINLLKDDRDENEDLYEKIGGEKFIPQIVQYFIETGFYKNALIMIKRLREDDLLEEHLAHYYRFIINRLTGKLDEALKNIDTAIELSGKEEFYVEKLECLSEQGDLDTAYQIAHDKINDTKNPELVEYFKETIGDYHYANGDFEESIKYFEEIYKNIKDGKKDKDFFIILKYIEALFNSDQFELALKTLRENKEFKDEREYMLLEARLVNKKNIDEAIHLYGKLLREHEDFYIPYIDMANIMVESGDIKGARNTLKKCMKSCALNENEINYIQEYLGQIE